MLVGDQITDEFFIRFGVLLIGGIGDPGTIGNQVL